MRKITLSIVFFILTLIASSCSSDEASKATLMKNTNPPIRFNPRTKSVKSNIENEKIKFVQTEAQTKTKLAQIESDKLAKLKEIEAKKATEIARVRAQKAQKIKELELKQTLNTNESKVKIASTKAKAQIAIEKEKQSHMLLKQKENLVFYRQLLIAAIILLFLLMIMIYLLYKHKQSLQLKLQKEKLKHEAYLLESKNHHERITKLLDIIANENTDKNIKKELTKLLKDQGEKPAILLESK